MSSKIEKVIRVVQDSSTATNPIVTNCDPSALVTEEEDQKLNVLQLGTLPTISLSATGFESLSFYLVLTGEPRVHALSLFKIAALLPGLKTFSYFLKRVPESVSSSVKDKMGVKVPEGLIHPAVERFCIQTDFQMYLEADVGKRAMMTSLVATLLQMASQCFPKLSKVELEVPDESDILRAVRNFKKNLHGSWDNSSITIHTGPPRICLYAEASLSKSCTQGSLGVVKPKSEAVISWLQSSGHGRASSTVSIPRVPTTNTALVSNSNPENGYSKPPIAVAVNDLNESKRMQQVLPRVSLERSKDVQDPRRVPKSNKSSSSLRLSPYPLNKDVGSTPNHNHRSF